MSNELAGKVALVTGASGSLGWRFAQVLATAGATVVLAARRAERLEAYAAELARQGAQALAVSLDVTSAASIAAAIERVERDAGLVDILVNNSGVAVEKPVLESDEADWDYVLDTNLKGAWLMSVAVARRLRDAGRPGSLINIASISGLRQVNQLTSYAVSKAGLVQLTKQMALELARYRIRVNALAPGYIKTDINREHFESPQGEAMLKRIPQRRIGCPEDLDAPLMLLASDTASLMTGAILVIDGGHMTSSL